jgi:hypothetical protein
MIMAIGVLGVMSLSGATLIHFSSANARTAEYSLDNGGAYDLAEAGVNEIMSILSKPENNALKGNLLPETTREYPEGTVTWSGTFDPLTNVWSITSTGKVKNPTGQAGDVTRRLTAKVPVTPTHTQPLNNPSWNYMMATRTGNSCDMTLDSSVDVGAPLYVFGNLCLNSSALVSGGPLVVKQQLKLLTSSNRVGSSSKPVNEVHVAGGCKYMSNAVQNPCRNGSAPTNSNVWATVLDNSPTALSAPVADFDGWYTNAMPGPTTNCSSATGARSGTPPTFENEVTNPTRNNSVPGAFLLTPSSSYTCRVGPASNPTGELSWNASTKVLTVRGTIFIDGSLRMDGSTIANYNGQATIYLSGTFLMNSSAQLCGGIASGNCDFATWNPNTEMLTIVANGNGASGSEVGLGNSAAFRSSTKFQGGIYATNAIWIDSSAEVEGPMVGSTLGITSSVKARTWPTLTTVPVGMPGNPQVYAQPNPPQLYSG